MKQQSNFQKSSKPSVKSLPEIPKPADDAGAWAKFVYWYKLRKRKQKELREQPQTAGEVLWSWTKTLVGAILVVMIINGLAIASFVVPTGSMENTVMTGDFLFVNKYLYGPSTPQVIPFVDVPLPFYKFPGFRDPERNDVIVFIFPGERDSVKSSKFQYYLKRCVAVAGDTLLIVNKKLYVNGAEIPLAPKGKFLTDMLEMGDQYRTFPKGKAYTRDNYSPIRIPKKGDVIPLNDKNYQEWEIFIKREGHECSLEANQVKVDNKVVTSYTVEKDYCFGMGDNRDNSLDSRYWGFVSYESVVGTPIIVYWSWDPEIPLLNIGKKFSSIRWSRIASIIK